MSNRIAIYLAGPIAGQPDSSCKGWRDLLISCDGSVDWINPMDRDYRGAHSVPPAYVVEPDKADIDRAHVVIAMVEPVSVGTSMEILYAWERGIPVVAVAPGNMLYVSPWIKYHATHLTNELLVALQVATSIAKPR